MSRLPVSGRRKRRPRPRRETAACLTVDSASAALSATAPPRPFAREVPWPLAPSPGQGGRRYVRQGVHVGPQEWRPRRGERLRSQGTVGSQQMSSEPLKARGCG